MKQQQLTTMLALEKSSSIPKKSIQSHPKRRLIADSLHKLSDDEKVSDDVFALTMNIFDRFMCQSSPLLTDRRCQLIALSCYNLAKKLRTNLSINNENELTSVIFVKENYSETEIFDTEQLIVQTLDWDLAMVVPHDYLQLLFEHLLPNDTDLGKIRLHVHILLALAICELNTLTVLPSVLSCACIKAAIKGLSILNIHPIDDIILNIIHCRKSDLLHTQRIIEQFFQSHLQDLFPTPVRRCLAPIDTSNSSNSSPRVK